MLFLAREDLRRLTGKVRFGAQRLALDRLGIRYTVAATGEPLVRLSNLDGAKGSARNHQPRWDLLNNA
jgi:hypothetical protein